MEGTVTDVLTHTRRQELAGSPGNLKQPGVQVKSETIPSCLLETN